MLAGTNDMREFYQSIWSSYITHPDQLLASNQKTLLMEKQDLFNTWTEQFSKLLSEASAIDQDTIDNLRQAPVQNWMDRCLEIDEIATTIEIISDGKLPDSDEIYPEMIKRRGQKLLCALHEINQKAWNTATAPQDWKDAQLVAIFKKGADNYVITTERSPSYPFLERFSHEFYSTDPHRKLKAQCGFWS